MSELDALIYKLAIAGFFASLIKRDALPYASLIILSFVINEAIFIKSPSWEQLSNLYMLYAIKDFTIAAIILYKADRFALILGLLFVASSLFHQFAQIQVYNHILYLKHMRTDFMIYITSAQLATMYLIILTGSGSNGGKRVKHNLPSLNRIDGRFFHTQAFKADR